MESMMQFRPRMVPRQPQKLGVNALREETPLLFVIEDDPGIRQMLTEFLVGVGYRVESAGNAMEALSRMDSGLEPNLILLDLMMPLMDGWEFRIEQRKRARIADVPVVVISADGSAKAAAITADAFMAKPLDLHQLRGVVERLLFATARRQLQSRARELERLRALGTLVAGVAHEINNPLTFVSANLELAVREWTRIRERLDVPPEVAARFERTIDAARVGADRIETVVRSLGRFSRIENEQIEQLDLHAVLDSAILLYGRQIELRGRLVKKYGEIPLVFGSEARLGQVFLNLIVNATQAIPSGDANAHEIRITTGVVDEMVYVEVSDTGPGIPEEIIPRIFEPFFTTKPAGEGTGLGLSLSRDIVLEHGGTLEAHSELGHGATFRVELPAIRFSKREGHPNDAHVATADGTHGKDARRMRILVVDDEPMVGAVLAEVLSEYEVVFETDAREALAWISAGRPAVDLVISDSRMPNLSGEAFFDELVKKRPELADRFFFMTGTVEPSELGRLTERSKWPTLRKPFSVAELLGQVSSVLTDAPQQVRAG
jgi:two-component system cell cycle sensor histidine kinase/response regulator CckA